MKMHYEHTVLRGSLAGRWTERAMASRPLPKRKSPTRSALRGLIQSLGVAVLAVLCLSPAPLNATSGIAKDSELVACTHLKATLRRLHRGMQTAPDAERKGLTLALLDLYQVDRRLGCSIPRQERQKGA